MRISAYISFFAILVSFVEDLLLVFEVLEHQLAVGLRCVACDDELVDDEVGLG